MTKQFISDVADIRVDKYLSDKITDKTRSDIAKLFSNQQILVNKKPVRSSYKLKLNDSIKITYELNNQTFKTKIDIPIIYEDNEVLVIDKPPGILSHSKGKDNPEQTVETFINDKLVDKDYLRAGIVHRLDRATSGVMICAKTIESYKYLQQQFSQRKVKKTYYAIASGKFDT